MKEKDSGLKHRDLTKNIIGIFYEVYNELGRAHEAQLLNYLRATQIEVGMLFNFGVKPEFKRMAFDNSRKLRGEHPSLLETLLSVDTAPDT